MFGVEEQTRSLSFGTIQLCVLSLKGGERLIAEADVAGGEGRCDGGGSICR